MCGIGSEKSRERNPLILCIICLSNDRDVASHRDIANAFADNVSHNSSSAFSTDAFISVRCKVEKQNINVSSENAEVYNRPYSLEELQDILRRAHDT